MFPLKGSTTQPNRHHSYSPIWEPPAIATSSITVTTCRKDRKPKIWEFPTILIWNFSISRSKLFGYCHTLFNGSLWVYFSFTGHFRYYLCVYLLENIFTRLQQSVMILAAYVSVPSYLRNYSTVFDKWGIIMKPRDVKFYKYTLDWIWRK